MKKYLILMILAFILSGCSILSTSTKQVSDQELFNRKKTCGDMQSQINSYIDKEWNDTVRAASLDKIFYSPKRNSCMYTMTVSLITTDGKVMDIYNLFDALTNEKIVSETGCLPDTDCLKSLDRASIDFRTEVAKYE